MKTFDQQDLARMADGLHSMNDNQWAALQDAITMQWLETAKQALGAGLDDLERNYECGCAAGLEMFRAVLLDLRSGTWRTWTQTLAEAVTEDRT